MIHVISVVRRLFDKLCSFAETFAVVQCHPDLQVPRRHDLLYFLQLIVLRLTTACNVKILFYRARPSSTLS